MKRNFTLDWLALDNALPFLEKQWEDLEQQQRERKKEK